MDSEVISTVVEYRLLRSSVFNTDKDEVSICVDRRTLLLKHKTISNMIEPEQETTFLCEDFIMGACPLNDHCVKVHSPLPYLWQLDFTPFHGPKYNLSLEISTQIEHCFCQPQCSEYTLEQPVVINTSLILKDVRVNFDLMMAYVAHPAFSGTIRVNRLSTMSYALPLLAPGDTEIELFRSKFYTQWRWYWYHTEDCTWKVFGQDCTVPDQQTLETKFCWPQRQLSYHFEIPNGSEFVITFEPRKFMMPLPFILGKPTEKELQGWPIRRRPLMASVKTCPEWPPLKSQPFVVSFPNHWTPLDTSRDWEVVKLRKTSDEYKQVTSEFINSVDSCTKRKVKEVFRVQNPFAWQKYVTKRNFMAANGNLDERILFHGTQMESAVKGIFQHNFDVRCYGVNNFVYGKGIYFAVRAGLSDRYAYKSDRRRNWMFLARVLVGKYEIGKREFSRPPPLDQFRPYAELYNSCVDNTFSPKLFVIFDSDQCYPDYVIGYVDDKEPDSDAEAL